MRTLALSGWVSLLAIALGCGSAPRASVASAVDRGDLDGALEAYDRFRAVEGADTQLLARVAALLLEREAGSDEAATRRAAIGQLGLAGTAGTPFLRRLAQAPGITPARLGALEALARRGDGDARLALRALADHADPDVVAASVVGMDPSLDRALLLGLARSESARVRREAIEKLGVIATEHEVQRALEEAARVDSEASVRAAAVRSLGRAGPEALPMLRERLSDPDQGVRMAAVGALMQADAARGRLALGAMLEVGPSVAGVEAARLLVLAGEGPEGLAGAPAARAFLRRALMSDDPALRSQAGVAIASLPLDREAPIEALRAALSAERDPEVRLSLARALVRHDPDLAREALRALVVEGEGMPRVQAAALLAAEGDREARAALSEVLASDEASILRRTAARALARDAMIPDAVRSMLRDADVLVRIYAAGGILAAAAAS